MNIKTENMIVEANSIEAFDALRDHLNDICCFPDWLELTDEQHEKEDEVRMMLAYDACNLPEDRMITNAFFVQNADETWAPENILEISHAKNSDKDYHLDNTYDDEQTMQIIRPVENRKFGPVRAPKNPDELGAAVSALLESPDAEEDFKVAMNASGMINDDDKIVEVKVCHSAKDGGTDGVMTYLTFPNVITLLVKDNNLVVMSGIDCERKE